MHNKKVSCSVLIIILVILYSLSACSQVRQEVPVTPTMSKSVLPTPQLKATCPVLNSSATLAGGKTESEIEQAILEYLNQGGSPEQLQDEIKKLQETSILDLSQVFTIDTNSDAIREIVLANTFGPPEAGDYKDIHSNLHIYQCAGGKYDDVLIVEGEPADTFEILAVENLSGSDSPEILISRRWTYLDIYFEFVEMYILKEEGWILSFKSEETECEIQTELGDGRNGHKELIIISGNDCSNNADESLMDKKWTYAFEENEVKLIQEGPFPSP